MKKIISGLLVIMVIFMFMASVYGVDSTSDTPSNSPSETPTTITPSDSATPVTATPSNSPISVSPSDSASPTPVTSSPSVSPSVSAIVTATSTLPVTYVTNNNYYHFEYSNTYIDNRIYNKTNNYVKINNTNINYGEQYYIKGGKTYINCQLISGEIYSREFRLAEGKNVVQFNKSGHDYKVEFWAYKKAKQNVKVENKIALTSNAKKQSQTVTVDTLPTTGQGQPTVYIVSGSIIILLGLGFLAKKVIKFNRC